MCLVFWPLKPAFEIITYYRTPLFPGLTYNSHLRSQKYVVLLSFSGIKILWGLLFPLNFLLNRFPYQNQRYQTRQPTINKRLPQSSLGNNLTEINSEEYIFSGVAEFAIWHLKKYFGTFKCIHSILNLKTQRTFYYNAINITLTSLP